MFFGGDPMLVYCYDEDFKTEANDQGFHKAAALLHGKMPATAISCFDKIKFGGKKKLSVQERLKLDTRFKPLIFICSNSEVTQMLPTDFGTKKGQRKITLTDDGYLDKKFVKSDGYYHPPKIPINATWLALKAQAKSRKKLTAVTSTAMLKVNCLNRPQCVLVVHDGKLGRRDKNHVQLLMDDSYKNTSYVTLDSSKYRTSLQPELDSSSEGTGTDSNEGASTFEKVKKAPRLVAFSRQPVIPKTPPTHKERYKLIHEKLWAPYRPTRTIRLKKGSEEGDDEEATKSDNITGSEKSVADYGPWKMSICTGQMTKKVVAVLGCAHAPTHALMHSLLLTHALTHALTLTHSLLLAHALMQHLKAVEVAKRRKKREAKWSKQFKKQKKQKKQKKDGEGEGEEEVGAGADEEGKGASKEGVEGGSAEAGEEVEKQKKSSLAELLTLTAATADAIFDGSMVSYGQYQKNPAMILKHKDLVSHLLLLTDHSPPTTL
jgi:hypothetical protein